MYKVLHKLAPDPLAEFVSLTCMIQLIRSFYQLQMLCGRKWYLVWSENWSLSRVWECRLFSSTWWCIDVSYHNYVDDTWIYVSLSAGEQGPINSLCCCIEQINVWMQNNFLYLISDKTEIIVFGPQHKRTSVICHLEFLSMKPKNQVRNLGVILDSELNLTVTPHHLHQCCKCSTPLNTLTSSQPFIIWKKIKKRKRLCPNLTWKT